MMRLIVVAEPEIWKGVTRVPLCMEHVAIYRNFTAIGLVSSPIALQLFRSTQLSPNLRQ